MTRFEKCWGIYIYAKRFSSKIVWTKPFPVHIPQHFSYLVILHLPAYEDGPDRVFRNVGIWNSDVGELPRRKHTTLRTRRKFEIKRIKLVREMCNASVPSLSFQNECMPSVNKYEVSYRHVSISNECEYTCTSQWRKHFNTLRISGFRRGVKWDLSTSRMLSSADR